MFKDNGSEAGRMAEWEESEWAEDDFRQKEIEEAEERMRRLSQPILPKTPKKLKSEAHCEACLNKYTVKHSTQRFCSRKCKDWYHNTVNPDRAARAIFFKSR